MKCPTCPSTALLITDRSGIEIDYCPDCRGVWLDRGELDKLIERATPAPAPAMSPSANATLGDAPGSGGRTGRRDWDDDDDDDDDDRRRSQSGPSSDGRPTGKRRKKGFLGDLFDF